MTFSFHDLCVAFCGKYEVLPPGPNHMGIGWERDYAVIEYCTRGRGVITIRSRSYSVSEGQCFAIFPQIPFVLLSEELDPWGSSWVLLKGDPVVAALQQAGVSETSPVFPWKNQPSILSRIDTLIEEYGDDSPRASLLRMSNAYRLLADLIGLNADFEQNEVASSTKTGDCVLDIIDYMKHNYFRALSITELCQRAGLSRTYFSALFRRKTGLSPQQYLIQLRMRIACDYLENPYTSISSIAQTIGYDPLSFSRVFRNVMGMSPSQYRALPKEMRVSLKHKDISTLTFDATHHEQ